MIDRKDVIQLISLLSLVSVGITVVFSIFIWPFFLTILILSKNRNWLLDLMHNDDDSEVGHNEMNTIEYHSSMSWSNNNHQHLLFVIAISIQVIHVTALIWNDYPYLYLNRFAFIPIRMCLSPLVSIITKGESVREKTPSWFHCVTTDLPQTHNVNVLLSSLSKHVRRDLKRKIQKFHHRGISTKTMHCNNISLLQDVPIIWEHQQRTVQQQEGVVGNNESALVEFIKRFLVYFLTTDAYIDRYYDKNGKLCALKLFHGCGRTFNNFVYFCSQAESQSGIWHYNHVRRLLRVCMAHTSHYDYINFSCHQDHAKKCAGCQKANHDNDSLLDVLYPFQFYKEPPSNIIHVTL
mmetsp:Transcript_5192/g.7319  ORF Transcript_5192/g.7319 Transcript_5192/m.7319 type:complete len:350 (-) Transcript_5192:1424-2473(-)